MNALRSNDDVLWGFGEIAMDSTDADRAERALLHQHAEREQRWQRDERMYRALMGALTSHIVALDQTGTIIMVNEAWTRFARENGAAPDVASGVGTNYLDVCRRAATDCEYAARALAGLEATMSGLQCRVHTRIPLPFSRRTALV